MCLRLCSEHKAQLGERLPKHINSWLVSTTQKPLNAHQPLRRIWGEMRFDPLNIRYRTSHRYQVGRCDRDVFPEVFQ